MKQRCSARILGCVAGVAVACSRAEEAGEHEERHEQRSARTPGHEQRSALLVTLDTTRADALSCSGAPPGTTPVLDALAREAVLYERAFTTAPITLPAHASMLTGLHPLRHGLRDNAIAALNPSAATLAEAARAGGVETAAFVAAVVLDRSFGLDQGFDLYDGPPSGRGSGGPAERPARAVIDAALAWLARRDAARPFFAWIHLYDAHHPYAPERAPAEDTERARYLAEVSAMDAELGRLFADLRARGLLERTLVCVTADHGEAFGEHLELSHGPFCWNTTLRVPLLIRHPDGRRAGERSVELVSVVDVAPTLADALGVTLGTEIDGRSLLGGANGERGLYFESMAGFLAFGWSPLAGWIDEQGKYLHGSAPQFFDLAADPREERDLAAVRGAELARYRDALAALAARPALAGSTSTIAEDLRADIQGLGYAAIDATGGVFPHPLEASERPFPHAMVAAWRESLDAVEKMNRERWDEARAILERLLAGQPGNGFVRGRLATCLMRLGEHERAYETLLPLVDAPVVQPQILYRIGVCAEALGRRAEALGYLARAVELAPLEPRFRERLERVQRAGEPGTGER